MFQRLLALSGAVLLYLISSSGYGQTAVNLTANGDAQISYANPTSFYGGNSTANVSVVSTTDYFRSLFGFSFSGIPSNAVIVSATLTLTVTSTGEGGATSASLLVQPITGTWTEGGVNFSNQPATSSANQQTSNGLAGTKRTFDVTLMLRAHFAGTVPLTGFMVRRAPETTTATPCEYHTREASTSSNRPVLSVSWYAPVGIGSATITKVGAKGGTNGGVSVSASGGNHSGGAASFTYQWYDASGAISGATTSSISGKAAGCYGVVISSTYGSAYTMLFLLGTRCEMDTIDVLKDPLFVDDAQVYSSASTTNYGTLVTLQAGRPAAGTHRFYLRYRVWPDANLSYYNATQYLYGSAHSASTNESNFYRTTADWDESTITWANKPAEDLTIPTPVYVAATASSTENKVLDLTGHWQYWNQYPTASFGYVMIGAVPPPLVNTYQRYHSSDATTAANRPYVKVILDDASCDRHSYYRFKREQDAALATTIKGKLRVQFTEEYQQTNKNWEMRLYNNNHDLIGGITLDGGSIPGSPDLLPAVNYVFGDNRATLDLTPLDVSDGSYYLLELTKSTGEKEYIEFIYKKL